MIEVTEAEAIINNNLIHLSEVTVPLEKATGRVLRQAVTADADMPPFDRVTMDGIGILFDDWVKGNRIFSIRGIQAAGMPAKKLDESNTCLEVMTGAILPKGCDTVVPYEDMEIADGKATVVIANLVQGKNVHRRGTDRKEGDILIESGRIIGTPEIALMASVGVTHVKVTRQPKIAVISTGNELVDIDKMPLPHQIRKSNVHALAAELRLRGIAASLHHCEDDRDVLKTQLSKLLETHDVLMLSGGVSKGKFDYVPEILESLGVKKHFHRIKQRPGKPMWFGSVADKKVVFAFPGNPVSTFLCFHRYFIPWLNHSLGNTQFSQVHAVLTQDFVPTTPLTYFLQVKLFYDAEAGLKARPVDGRGSGDHANLTDADAFLELPSGRSEFLKGEVYKVFRYREGF